MRLPAPPRLLSLGSFLGVPLSGQGRFRGALYLARAPGQPAFTAQDEETVFSICTWLEQGSLFEESRLLAQLELLNHVAQAAAGNPDLPRLLAARRYREFAWLSRALGLRGGDKRPT